MHLMPYIGKDEHPSNLNLSKTANNNLHFHLVGPVSALLKFLKGKGRGLSAVQAAGDSNSRHTNPIPLTKESQAPTQIFLEVAFPLLNPTPSVDVCERGGSRKIHRIQRWRSSSSDLHSASDWRLRIYSCRKGFLVLAFAFSFSFWLSLAGLED